MERIEKYKGISYQLRQGENIPLIFIHGFCEDRSIWEETISAFPEHTTLALDLPGFGDSDLLPGLRIENAADRIIELLEKTGIREYLLFGHSMGGYISLAIAEKSDRLKGLGLIHSHPFADSEEKKAGRQKAQAFVKEHGSLPFLKQLIPSLFAPDFRDQKPDIIRSLIERARHLPPAAIIEALEAMRLRPDRSSIIEEASFPVLFIIGKKDEAIPEEYSLKQTRLPAVGYIRIFEKAGHMSLWEAKADYLSSVSEFISYCQT
jgi:pimeloyl-ACP methyl ester carboxylesterase